MGLSAAAGTFEKAAMALGKQLATSEPSPVKIIDDVFDQGLHKRVRDYLHAVNWRFGWRSSSATDIYCFWHKHYAGHKKTNGQKGEPYPCVDELEEASPFLFDLWHVLERRYLTGHTLYRCYANAMTYGSDGTIHRDSKTGSGFTAVYYPHEKWEPNWAGETVIFNPGQTDIVAAVYPRPNRMVIFPGDLPHVARGVSRTCPALRVILAFKTEKLK